MHAERVAEVVDDRYELGPVIGSGGMGEVRRALDTRLGRDVAIKFLASHLISVAGVRDRFVDEARSAARLSHPAIVAVYDTGEWRGAPYVVMECLPGRTLADEIADGPVPAARVRVIARDVGSALAAAHRAGILHRDVKPGNILLTETGGAKLADFGIAKSTEGLDHTTTGHVIGTAAYLAPERLDGVPATACSDLYSLAIVLYEALTGEKPVHGDAPIARRMPGLDAGLASAIDTSLARRPEDRIATAEQFLATIGSSQTDELEEVDPDATQLIDVRRDPTEVMPRQQAPARRDRRGLRRSSFVAALVTATVAIGVLVASAGSPESGGPDPTTTTSLPAPRADESLPRPLDDALSGLEESVQP
jgi:serine/threonine protein kinase